MTQFRQGDVLLIKVDSLPELTEAVEREDGRLVLARGEATGHAHVVRERRGRLLQWRNSSNWTYLDLPVPAKVEHEEHAPIDLEPGVYRVLRQREYSPERSNYVAD